MHTFEPRRARLAPCLTLACAVWLAGLGVSVPVRAAASAPDVDKASAVQAAPASGGTAAPAVPRAFTSAPASAPAGPPPRRWMSVPRVYGRITAQDLGLVVNLDDPYSVQVGEYYARTRRIPEHHILRVNLPVKSALTPQEFEDFNKRVQAFYGDQVQGLALAWRMPYGVDCQSITGALAMGFDSKLCAAGCGPSRPSTYFGTGSARPFKDHGMRLSMLLAARDVDAAKALIDRGVKSDGSLGLRGAPPVTAHFVITSDSVRSVRQVFYPPATQVNRLGVDVQVDRTDALKGADRVLIYMTGRTNVDWLDTVNFVPGALADHLTSFGGVLDKPHGQMTVLSWIHAGATASYGTASEPCAHWQKFPHPQALLLFYMQGATALEAYWKSVLWPSQGVFVGEPLAAPFARDAGRDVPREPAKEPLKEPVREPGKDLPKDLPREVARSEVLRAEHLR